MKLGMHTVNWKKEWKKGFLSGFDDFTEESLKYAHSNVTKSKEEIFKALSNEIAGKDEEGLKNTGSC